MVGKHHLGALGAPLALVALLAALQGLSPRRAEALPARDRLDRCAVVAWMDVDGREAIERCRRLHLGYAYRAWFNWAGQYPYLQRWVVPELQATGAVFGGGVTFPAYYPHQRAPEGFQGRPERDEDWLTCSPRGVPQKVADSYYHGSLYEPRYRNWIDANAREQIRLGVDAISFDEICGALSPPAGGYDKPCLDQFRTYLLAKYAGLTPAEWKARFDIAKPDAFDYRQYLADHGWLDTPETGANPLAPEFGNYNGWLEGRSNQHPYHEEGSFRRQAWLGIWQGIVDATRRCGREAGRDLLVSANGLAPFVDVQDFALLFARPGTLQSGLDGSISILDRWHSYLVDSRERYGLNIPVMGHHDWHDAKTNPDIYDLPVREQNMFLRLYSAEAYAAGGFYCFSEGGGGGIYAPDSATHPTQEQLAGFYQQYASFYARCFPKGSFSGTVATNTPHLAVKAWYQPGLRRVLVHLINHNWDATKRDIVPQSSISVTVQGGTLGSRLRAWIVSPDFADAKPLPVTVADGCVKATVPSLQYYDVLVLEPQPAAAAFGALAGTVTESHGRPVAGATVSLWGTDLRATTDQQGRYRFPRVSAEGPAAGFYEINAEAPGYWPGRAQGVRVQAGATTTQPMAIRSRDLIEDFEAGAGAWLQMSRPARPYAAGMRVAQSTCPDGGATACVISLSRKGSDGHEGDRAEATRDTPVTEVVRGVSGNFDAETDEVRFWAKSLSGPARVQLILREYDSIWDLSEGPKSPSHATELTIEPGAWHKYVVPLSSLRPLNAVPLRKERVRLLLLRALEDAPTRVALDELAVHSIPKP